MSRHILFLCHLPWVRGGSMYAMGQLVKAVAGAGNRVTVVAPVPAAMDGPAQAGISLGSVRVLEFTLPVVSGAFLGYRGEIEPPDLSFDEYFSLQARRALPLLREVVVGDPPDLIVLGHEIFLWHVIDTVRTWGIPTALVTHGPLAATVNGEMKAELVEPLIDHLRRVDLVMPVAHYMTRFVEDLGIAARTVHNIVETDRFHPHVEGDRMRRSLGLDERDVVVAHASTMRPIKRVMDIVDAAAQALAREPRLTYLIYGDGPMREDMERRCGALGIGGRVRFMGWVSHGDMHGYVRAADMSVLSSASEGMPYGALEALSSGRPVVTSDLAWTQEVLEHGQCMATFPAGDVAAFAQRTLEAAADGRLRMRMGDAGRAFVEGHHRTDRVVDAFMAAVTPLMTRNAVRERQRDNA